MRAWAIALFLVATALVFLYTSFGPSPGLNKFRHVMELLILAVGLGAIAITARNRRTRLAGGALLFAALCVLGVLVLPVTDPVRKDLLAPVLASEGRGLVLAALGRPDLVSVGGVGTAANYGYRSSSHPGQILLVRFTTNQVNEDQVQSAGWLGESEGQRTYDLQPPG